MQQLAAALPGREVLSRPYVTMDPSTSAHAGLAADYTRLLAQGEDTLRALFPGVTPDRSLYLVRGDVDGAGLQLLRNLGALNVVLPSVPKTAESRAGRGRPHPHRAGPRRRRVGRPGRRARPGPDEAADRHRGSGARRPLHGHRAHRPPGRGARPAGPRRRDPPAARPGGGPGLPRHPRGPDRPDPRAPPGRPGRVVLADDHRRRRGHVAPHHRPAGWRRGRPLGRRVLDRRAPPRGRAGRLDAAGRRHHGRETCARCSTSRWPRT